MDISYIHEQVPVHEAPSEAREKKNILEKISFILLSLTLFLTPLVFLTTNYAPIDTAKNIVMVFGVLFSSIFYVLSLFKTKSFSIPKNAVINSGLFVVLTILISTFTSDSIQKSIIGQGFEIGTTSFLCLLFLVAFLTSRLVVKNKDRLIFICCSIGLSFIVLSIFQVIRLFVDPAFLSFGVLASSTSTLVGKWSDFGVFSGMIFLLSFFVITLLKVQRSVKVLTYILLALSAIMVIIVNSPFIWSAIIIVLLGYGIYHFSIATTKRISISILLLIIASIFFLIKGGDIIKPLSINIQVDTNELSLPWQLTLDVASDTIKDKPLFGAGPNRFTNEYLLYKPAIVNSSDFWGIEFNNSFGFIPTFLVTGGLVGIIAWILFLVFFVRAGVLAIKKEKQGNPESFIPISTFFVSAFLIIMALLYSPSHTILLITAVFVGLFVSSLPYAEYKHISSKKIVTLVLVASLIILAFWTLAYLKKTVSLGYFRSGINSLSTAKNEKALENAESSFKTALVWDKSDIYYQALAEVVMIRIQSTGQQLLQVAQNNQKQIDQKSLDILNSLLEKAIGYSRDAIQIDPTNYYNYISEARVSELALSLQVKNAYENVKNSYLSALRYNPYNPSIYLNLARIEASQNKFDEAQKYIGAALQVKPNYTEAIFLLSQIQVNNGQIKDAIISTQFAIQTNPNNSLLHFQLGLLQYNDKNYQGAVDALQNAIKINDQYANARYFLGLAYARLGKYSDAIIQFENLAASNPDNKEVLTILTNLKSGKSPFNDILPPSDSRPEKRSTLPVKEKATTSKKTLN